MEDERDRNAGTREGLGILATLREALDEVIAEAREKGGVSADRAREALRDAASRARDAAGEARHRLDFASRQDLQDLREAVAALRVRVEGLERRVSGEAPPTPEETATTEGPGEPGPGGAGGTDTGGEVV